MPSPSFHRSTVAALLSAALVTTALGCGDDSPTESGGSSGASSGGTSLQGKSAVLTTFGGPLDEAIKTNYMEPTTSSTGLKIALDGPTDYSKLATQVKTDNVTWSAVMGDGFYSIANCGKTLQEIDKTVDRSDIDPKYLVSKCSAPGETYSYVVLYDEDKFKADPPTSWADFFDLQKYPGKRGVFGAYVFNGTLEGALLGDGVQPDALYPLDVDRALKKLGSIKSETTFFDSLAAGQQQVEAGEVAMAVLPADNGLYANQNGAKFAPIWNQQVRAFNDYVAPKGADPDAAAAILQTIVSTKAQSGLRTSDPSGGVTVKEFEGEEPTDPLKRQWSELVDGRGDKAIDVDQKWWADNLDAAQSKWTAFVSG